MGVNHGITILIALWIPDVRAVGTNQARLFLRKKILDWMEDSDYSNKHIWSEDVLARIFYLLTNLSFFFETANESFQKKFAKNINKQCVLLLNSFNHKEENIFTVKSLILSTLCFENQKNYSYIIDQLNTLIKKTILEDGVHYLRSPSEHFFSFALC